MKIFQNSGGNIDETAYIRKVITVFFIIILIIFTCFTVLFTIHDYNILKYLLYSCIIQHGLWLFGFLFYREMPFEPLIKMYLSYIVVALFPIACIFWNSGDHPVVFFWYVLVIIGAIVFQMNRIGIWGGGIITMVICSIFFGRFLFPKIDVTPLFIHRVNILTVISTIVLASFFAIIYMRKIDIYNSIHPEKPKEPAESSDNYGRDIALFNEIIEYLENNKPFKDSNFNAQTLAKALNSNVNYISKAIHAGGCGNFNTLINNLRINYVKTKLDDGTLKKYTIDYIYTEAGYKYRSTFNTAFKSVTGMTPSDYVSQKKLNGNV